MSDIIDWVAKLQALGVAGLALMFLYLTARYFIGQAKEKAVEHESEKTQIRSDFQTVIEAKDTVITGLSSQLREAAQQSRTDMERHLERQVEATRRTEEVIAGNTVAVQALQEVVRSIPRGGGT